MKKKRKTISIKDAQLRKVRDNLRLLLLEATTVQWRKYFDEQHKLHLNLEGNYRNLSESKKRERAH